MTRSLAALRHVTLAACCLAWVVPASAQDPAQVQRWFESGQFQQVTDAATPESPAEVRYLAGQSFQKQNAPGQAAEMYRSLMTLPESNAWHFVGMSAAQLVDGQTDAALASAQQAVATNGGLPEAHYQLGLVYARRNDWGSAAQAFDRTSQIDPGFAYAHYYGGLASYRAGRPDRMAIHFEQFLKAAPDAPERAEVLQLMRSVRGR